VSRGGYRPVTPHVRLFVQNEGPPKCLYRYDGPPPPDPTFMPPNQFKWFRHAARWWLVLCESAEAGRDLIAAAAQFPGTEIIRMGQVVGRILASGGKP